MKNEEYTFAEWESDTVKAFGSWALAIYNHLKEEKKY